MRERGGSSGRGGLTLLWSCVLKLARASAQEEGDEVLVM